MANLNAKQRKALPKSKFGLPSRANSSEGKARSGSFPMPDKAHAEAALRLVGRSEKAGNITARQAAEVRAKAHRILGTPNKKAAGAKRAAKKR